MDFSQKRGWSAPEIRTHGPLDLDPACSCFHYFPNVFEGLKVSRWFPKQEHDILCVRRLYLYLYPSSRRASTRAAAALPPDSRGGYDDC